MWGCVGILKQAYLNPYMPTGRVGERLAHDSKLCDESCSYPLYRLSSIWDHTDICKDLCEDSKGSLSNTPDVLDRRTMNWSPQIKMLAITFGSPLTSSFYFLIWSLFLPQNHNRQLWCIARPRHPHLHEQTYVMWTLTDKLNRPPSHWARLEKSWGWILDDTFLICSVSESPQCRRFVAWGPTKKKQGTPIPIFSRLITARTIKPQTHYSKFKSVFLPCS